MYSHQLKVESKLKIIKCLVEKLFVGMFENSLVPETGCVYHNECMCDVCMVCVCVSRCIVCVCVCVCERACVCGVCGCLCRF